MSYSINKCCICFSCRPVRIIEMGTNITFPISYRCCHNNSRWDFYIFIYVKITSKSFFCNFSVIIT